MSSVGYEIPRDTYNYAHDFRVAIFSFRRNFDDIANFDFDTADIVINPEGITNVGFAGSVATSPQSGSFTIVGGLGVQKTTNSVTLNKNSIKYNKMGGTSLGDVENHGMDLGYIFSNSSDFIEKMDYVAVYTKDPRTNMWFGSKSYENSAVPKDAKPKFLGIVSSITVGFNVQENRMMYTVNFKNMLRILELQRYAASRSQWAVLQTITGKDVGEGLTNEILDAEFFTSTEKAPWEIITSTLKQDYPTALIESRIEHDKTRGVLQRTNVDIMVPTNAWQSSWDTKLNKFKQYATNKDFEFYAAEDGKLVWKLPTYARGINKIDDNKVTTEQFDPQNLDKENLYHIHDFVSISLTNSEGELINFVSGANDWAVNGVGNLGQVFEGIPNAYFIAGGTNTPDSWRYDRGVGFRDIGVRPAQIRNEMAYNLSQQDTPTNQQTNFFESQLWYYDYKVWKNNVGKEITASLTMIDNPAIEAGKPCIIPLFAEAGSGKLKGKILPAIFYISATQRRYEFNKYPVLQLTLTHGRFISDEFHNGIHIYDKVSPWIKASEPDLVYQPEGLSSDVMDDSNNKQRMTLVRNTCEKIQQNRLTDPPVPVTEDDVTGQGIVNRGIGTDNRIIIGDDE